jgi:hypothetical protein
MFTLFAGVQSKQSKHTTPTLSHESAASDDRNTSRVSIRSSYQDSDSQRGIELQNFGSGDTLRVHDGLSHNHGGVARTG